MSTPQLIVVTVRSTKIGDVGFEYESVTDPILESTASSCFSHPQRHSVLWSSSISTATSLHRLSAAIAIDAV